MARQTITPLKVIDALGGVKKVARILKTTDRVVYNWRRGKFPANTYVRLQMELAKHELSVPDSLWTMKCLPVDKPRKQRNGK